MSKETGGRMAVCNPEMVALAEAQEVRAGNMDALFSKGPLGPAE
ncbi:MAG: hypothetical protein ACREDR_13045 [Blastocatellia bacterium]